MMTLELFWPSWNIEVVNLRFINIGNKCRTEKNGQKDNRFVIENIK